MSETGRGTLHEVTAATAGERLDRTLAAALAAPSRSRLKALIEDGRVTTDGSVITDPSYRVKQGQTFAIFIPEPAPAAPAPEPIALDIVFEDEHLIVIDKPAGLVVHPAPGNVAGTLVNALLAHCAGGLSGIGGVRRPGIVHRLDKDTSGLLVAAKTDAAHAALSAQFAARIVSRSYLALVWGVPRPAAGEISGNIGRSTRDRKKMALRRNGGRTALTRYATRRRFGTVASLLECRLATGRTHQIRVHLMSIGHPVMGDASYGGGLTAARRSALGPAGAACVAGLRRQALHAATLGFVHPESGDKVSFESDLPRDMSELISCLENL